MLADTDSFIELSTDILQAGEGYQPPAEHFLYTMQHADGSRGWGYNDTGDDSEENYNPEHEPQPNRMRLHYRGTAAGGVTLFAAYAVACAHINGADDDHYDYWPSHFSAMCHIAEQLDEQLGGDQHRRIANYTWNEVADDYVARNTKYTDFTEEGLKAYHASQVTERANFADEIMPEPFADIAVA